MSLTQRKFGGRYDGTGGGVFADPARWLRPAAVAALCVLAFAVPRAAATAGDAAAATNAAALSGGDDAAAAAAEIDATMLSCDEHPYEVVVKVENMRNLDGLLTVELYNDNPEGFIKKAGRLERYRVNATRSESELCLIAPGPGTYAVVVYHDENGNKKFDKNFLGIPTEGFGVSNNPGFSLGPPALEDSAFTLDAAPISLTISMNYL